ncbi:fimbrial protein [Photorhabdus sp. CRCIA-P01]|uniref:fimbrial protein n=1 Tax=Photorhabdus sp. CRCIA-P01 TaxID=2019570 RepID=UPI0013008547|nr:fimbrial protein [Photorhabdus sp. CRCIA-P01]
MKKNLILASLVTVLGIASSFSALSYDGTIKFKGTILENGCTVASTDAKGIQEINFGKILKQKFKNEKGSIAAVKPFSIALKNCPESSVAIQFSGTQDPDDSTLYKSPVSGVGILLAKDDGTKINANTSVNGYKTNNNKDLNIPLIAKLQSTKAKVGAGDINSEVNFTLIYQ